MADKVLQIGDDTDSNHGIQAKTATGSPTAHYNSSIGKWEISNDGIEFLNLSGGSSYPSSVLSGTDENALSITPIDLSNPLLMWDQASFNASILSTSWYSELGPPPVHGFLYITNDRSKVIWRDRVTDSNYMSFTAQSLYMVAALANDVLFLDGIIYVASGSGLAIIDLIMDSAKLVDVSGTYVYTGNISDRNTGLGHFSHSSSSLINTISNSVSAHRDTGGSIDIIGRPKHWWAVATSGGGSVYNPTDGGIYDPISTALENTSIAQDGTLVFAGSGPENVKVYNNIVSNSSDSISSSYDLSFSLTPYLSGEIGSQYYRSMSILSGASVAEVGSNVIAIGLNGSTGGGNAQDCLNLIHENKASPRDSGVIFVSDSFNSPYMKGEVVGCWPLQGDGDDVGKNDLDLTNVNSVAFDGDGVYGSEAPDFVAASSRYLEHADDSLFDTGESMTISCWVYREVDSAENEGIVGKWDSNNNGKKSYLLYVSDTNNQIYFRVYTSSDGFISGPVISLNTWYHIAATYDGSNMRIYVNGVETSSGAQTGSVQGTSTKFSIGGFFNNASPYRYFDGKIQNVVLAKSVYTQREIEFEYRRGLSAIARSTSDTLGSNSIRSVYVDGIGGHISVVDDSQATILDQGGIPIVVESSPGGTMNDMCSFSMITDDLPHYAIGTTSHIETVQGEVDSRPVRASIGHISPREIVGPVKIIGDGSIKSHDAIIAPDGTGDYRNVNDAIASGAKNILLREGTFPPFSVSVNGTKISGSGFNTIIDGSDTSNAITVNGNNITIQDLSAKTTAGQGNLYHAVSLIGLYGSLINCKVISSDHYGINIQGDEVLIRDCIIQAADQHAIYINGPRARVIGNHFNDCGNTDDIYVGPSGDNFTISGNHCEGTVTTNAGADDGIIVANITDQSITDNAGSSVVQNNVEY